MFIFCSIWIFTYAAVTSAEPPAKRYQSAFRVPANQLAFSSAVPLTFDSYTFRRTFCTVDEQGGITLVEKSDPETVLIAQGWQKFVAAGIPSRGYISKGYSKYAFHVRPLLILSYPHHDLCTVSLGFVRHRAPCHIPGKELWRLGLYRCRK